MRLRCSTFSVIPYQTLLAVTLLVVTGTGFQFLLVSKASAANPQASAAPDFALPGLDGDRALQDYRGHYLYVDFWASWCGPCRKSFPWMNDMQAKYEDHGLRIIAINLDEKRVDARRFLDAVPTDVDIAFDANGITAEAFNIKGMPSSYLINPAGDIVFSHVGFRERDTAALEAEIARLMGES